MSAKGNCYDNAAMESCYDNAAMESCYGNAAMESCYDNAAMESCYGRYNTSSVRDLVFANEDQAKSNAFEYIELFYNRFRKHSSLDYKSPVQFEDDPPPMGRLPASLPAYIHNN